MFKNLMQVYSLIVCLAASAVMMIALGIMLGSGTDLVLTEYKNMRQLRNYDNDAKYIEYKKQEAYNDHDKQQWKVPNPDQIKEKRMDDREDYINGVKGNAISSIINCITWLLIGLLFFIIHWRMYRHSRSNKTSI